MGELYRRHFVDFIYFFQYKAWIWNMYFRKSTYDGMCILMNNLHIFHFNIYYTICLLLNNFLS